MPYGVEERVNKKRTWTAEVVQITQVVVEKRNMAGEVGKGGVQHFKGITITDMLTLVYNNT